MNSAESRRTNPPTIRPATTADGLEMDDALDWRAATFGILLGCGLLLTWRGFRAVTDKSLDEAERRRGMWTLNSGIALAAVSMLGITLVASG